MIGRRKNPYDKSRVLPVGHLGYPFPCARSARLERVDAELEHGEREFLYHLPLLVNGGIIGNLGDGGSATIFALSLIEHQLPGRVYTVDFYDDVVRRRKLREREELGVAELVVLIHESTRSAKERLRRKTFSLLFVDANHEYEHCRTDVLMYESLVPERGYMAFHDTNQESVDRVIQELVMPTWEMLWWVNRIKVFRRQHGRPVRSERREA